MSCSSTSTSASTLDPDMQMIACQLALKNTFNELKKPIALNIPIDSKDELKRILSFIKKRSKLLDTFYEQLKDERLSLDEKGECLFGSKGHASKIEDFILDAGIHKVYLFRNILSHRIRL
jgi:hypothetical protein